MKTLTPQEESKLVKAIEQSINLANGGMSPNDAILKVASDNGYTPPFVRLMATAFNKSKSVHILKTADEKHRSATFDLADPDEIVSRMYSPETILKTASQAPVEIHELSMDYSRVDLDGVEPVMEKVAAKINPPVENVYTRYRHANLKIEPASVMNVLTKYAAVKEAVHRRLEQNVSESTHVFFDSIDDVAEIMRPITQTEFQKTAQLLLNGYPTTGEKLVKLLAAKTQHSLPETLQKTAKSAVFPTSELFISIEKLVTAANELVDAKNALAVFEKQAEDGLLEDFFAHAGAIAVNKAPIPESVSESLVEKMTAEKKPRTLDEDLDPDFYNTLQEIDTRRNFMNMALYDDDLNKYDFPSLVTAYNNTIQMAPEAKDNPVILRNLMLTNLETGGIKDPFTIKTELDIGKTLLDKSKLKSDIQRNTATMAVPKNKFPEKAKPSFSEKPKASEPAAKPAKRPGSDSNRGSGDKGTTKLDILNNIRADLVKGVPATKLSLSEHDMLARAAESLYNRQQGTPGQNDMSEEEYSEFMSELDSRTSSKSRDRRSRGDD